MQLKEAALFEAVADAGVALSELMLYLMKKNGVDDPETLPPGIIEPLRQMIFHQRAAFLAVPEQPDGPLYLDWRLDKANDPLHVLLEAESISMR
jgi:hypothetical protein